MDEIISEIKRLKTSRNAIILAHNYQIDEVQEVADFVGDSLELARQAAKTDSEVIVLCGVYFMAETAAILNPEKTVLLPDEHSGCPLADMIDAKKLSELKSRYPGVPVVCYVNSSAEVKAESDVCCTSSNAIKIVESLKTDTVIFIPDRNLGDYVQTHTQKKMIVWDGFCPTHDRVTVQEIQEIKDAHPEALFIAHPECRREVLLLADEVSSTSGMLRYVRNSTKDEFIIGTEEGLLYRLKKENPQKRFYLASPKLICPNMKKNNLNKIYQSLVTLSPVIKVSPEVRRRAVLPIEKMLSVRK